MELINTLKGFFSKKESQPERKSNGFLKKLDLNFMRLTHSKEATLDYIEMILVKDSQGVSTIEAITDILEKKSQFHPKGHTAIKQFYADIIDRFESSANPVITTALEPYLNKTETMIAQAGNDPMGSLKAVLEFNQHQSTLKSTIIKAAIKPFLYLAVVIIMINAFDGEIVATMKDLVASFGKEPQGALLALITLHDVVIDSQFLVVPLIFIIVATYLYGCSHFKGNARVIFEKIPLFGYPFRLNRQTNGAIFLKLMAFLYRNGANTYDAITGIKQNASAFMKYELELMLEIHRMKGGDSETFNSPLFVGEVSFKLSVLLGAKDVDKYLGDVAEKIEKEIQKQVGRVSVLINVIGLVTVASYFLLFMISNFSIREYVG